MSNKKEDYMINLFGTDVDFSVIVTDDVPEIDITDRILEEKASLLLYRRKETGAIREYMNKTPNFSRTPPKTNSFYASIEKDLMYNDVKTMLVVLGCDAKAYGKVMYNNEKNHAIFPINGDYCPKKTDSILECHDRILKKYSMYFNPEKREFLFDEHPYYLCVPWGPYWHEYTGDFKTIPLSFKFNDEYGNGDMFIFKCYGLVDNRFIKLYYPLSFVGIKSEHYWAVIPRADQQHLFNLDMVKKASTVVICTTLEDAWAFQNSHKNTEGIAFTDYRSEDYEQVDFSPLKDKNIIFLASNSNSVSLAERCLEVADLSNYLVAKGIAKSDRIMFVLREIRYPAVRQIADFKDFLERYKQQPPTIRKDSLKSYTESNFDAIKNKAEEEIERKKNATVEATEDKPFYQSEEPETNNQADPPAVKSIYDKMIIRPILYEGTVTVLSALAKTGKSRFALKLCRLFVAKNSRGTAITGMAIKKCYREHESEKSAVYLAYDGNISGTINSIKKTEFNDSDLFIPIKADELSELPKRDADALIKKIKEKSLYKSNGKPIPVGIIVIDTVRAFSGQDKNVDVLKTVSEKLTEAFPQAAILWLHHLNKEGKAAGGDEFVGVASVNINFKRYDDYSNSNKKFHYDLTESNLQFSNEDAEANIRLTEDGDFIVVDPERTENDMIEKVYNYYTKKVKGKKRMDSEKASNLLGFKDSSGIRQIRAKKEKDGQESQ